MAAQFLSTSPNLLSKLREAGEESSWQVSWKRFLELYHEPIEVIARGCYAITPAVMSQAVGSLKMPWPTP